MEAKPWNRMTRDEQRERSAEIARAERVAQGLPAVICDPVVLAKVARIADGADLERVAS